MVQLQTFLKLLYFCFQTHVIQSLASQQFRKKKAKLTNTGRPAEQNYHRSHGTISACWNAFGNPFSSFCAIQSFGHCNGRSACQKSKISSLLSRQQFLRLPAKKKGKSLYHPFMANTLLPHVGAGHIWFLQAKELRKYGITEPIKWIYLSSYICINMYMYAYHIGIWDKKEFSGVEKTYKKSIRQKESKWFYTWVSYMPKKVVLILFLQTILLLLVM